MTNRRLALKALGATALHVPALALLSGIAREAAAQATGAWPSKPVRLIVPYATGGTSDAAARLLADRLSPVLGQSVIVDNRAGAGGVTGMDIVAKATDGHTFAMAAVSPLTLLPYLTRVPYDPLKDFAPISLLMYSPVYVIASPAFTGKTFADVIAQAKAKPGTVTMATSGVGTVGHLMLEQIKRKAGVDIVHVPYKGGSQIFADAAGGHFDLFLSNPSPNLNGMITQGRLRVLAVTGPNRLPVFPNIPTLEELGHPQANLTSQYGIFAPAKTPQDVVRRLNTAVNSILAQKDIQEKLVALDNIVSTGTPEQFAQAINSIAATNSQAIKDAGIKLE